MMEFPNEEQTELIKLHTFLPLLLYVFDRDRTIIDASSLKTKGPYLLLMNKVIRQVEQELQEVKKKWNLYL
jgi:hypothetical protein